MIPAIDNAEMFEGYIQFVYEKLLNLSGEGIQVAHRTKLRGRSHGWYEIDVYYEFVRAEVVHRVAFECKYWNKRVDRDQILAFHSKLTDIGNIHGVIVSKLGFQRGAREYAEHFGIDVRTLDDLPGFAQAVGMQLAAAALPDPAKRGEPFWVIMEEATASYWSIGSQAGAKSIPLFISKLDAQRFCEKIPDRNGLVVCGLPIAHLSFLVGFARMNKKIEFGIVPWMPETETSFEAIPQSPDDIQVRFIEPLRTPPAARCLEQPIAKP